MNTAVTMSTKSSLLVVDEFGKGTSEVDGLSLLTAFLTHLIVRGATNCPHVVLSTHFHRLVDLIGNKPLLRALVSYLNFIKFADLFLLCSNIIHVPLGS